MKKREVNLSPFIDYNVCWYHWGYHWQICSLVNPSLYKSQSKLTLKHYRPENILESQHFQLVLVMPYVIGNLLQSHPYLSNWHCVNRLIAGEFSHLSDQDQVKIRKSRFKDQNSLIWKRVEIRIRSRSGNQTSPTNYHFFKDKFWNHAHLSTKFL